MSRCCFVHVLFHQWDGLHHHELPFQKQFSRTVWLLWLDGWQSAPWLVKEVAKSYERHNPGWKSIRLDSKSLRQHVDIHYINSPDIMPATKSDIIRLSLLAKHGGVWADATMLCFALLDSWLHEGLMPSEFWMYHGRDGGKGPAS